MENPIFPTLIIRLELRVIAVLIWGNICNIPHCDKSIRGDLFKGKVRKH